MQSIILGDMHNFFEQYRSTIVPQVVEGVRSGALCDRNIKEVKMELLDLMLGFRDHEGKRMKAKPFLTHGQARELFCMLNQVHHD